MLMRENTYVKAKGWWGGCAGFGAVTVRNRYDP